MLMFPTACNFVIVLDFERFLEFCLDLLRDLATLDSSFSEISMLQDINFEYTTF